MFENYRGRGVDLTPAQGIATVLAGVPIAANLMRSLGPRSDGAALKDSVIWSSVVAGALIGGDALLRAAQLYASSRTESMAMDPLGTAVIDPDEIALEDVEAAAVLDDELPSDDEELAQPPTPVAS
jgi:hypothetical protein